MSKLIKHNEGPVPIQNVLEVRVKIVLNGIDEEDGDMRIDESDIVAEVESGIKSELSQFYEVAKVEAYQT